MTMDEALEMRDYWMKRCAKSEKRLAEVKGALVVAAGRVHAMAQQLEDISTLLQSMEKAANGRET